MEKRELAQIPSPQKHLTLSVSPRYSFSFLRSFQSEHKAASSPSRVPLEQRIESEAERCAASSVISAASAASAEDAAAAAASDADTGKKL